MEQVDVVRQKVGFRLFGWRKCPDTILPLRSNFAHISLILRSYSADIPGTWTVFIIFGGCVLAAVMLETNIIQRKEEPDESKRLE